LKPRSESAAAARQFLTRALRAVPSPVEVTTDRAPVYPRIVEDLVPAAGHVPSSTPTTSSKLITAS
jgi:transposase-like protein